MVKLWSSLLVVVVAVLVAAGSVSAAEGKKKEGKKGERKRPSVEQMAEKIFEKLDTDKSKDLSLDEFKASPRMKDKKKAEEIFNKIKKNDEGKVTVKELTEWLKERRAAHRKEGGKKGEGRKHHKKGEKKGEKKGA